MNHQYFMHGHLIISVFVFATVFLFLRSVCVLIRFLVRTNRKQVSRSPSSNVPRELDPWVSRDEFEHRVVEQPPLMPPPLPTNEFEFHQAGQYALDQNLPPLPSPPPKHERDNW
jgi:hypothetical protein